MLEESFFGERFIDCNTNKEVKDIFLDENDLICLYFASSWCPISHSFTEYLAKDFYDIINKDKHRLEIIYIPVDDNEDFERAIAKMPWLAYNVKDSSCNSFKEKFKVNLIPELIILTPDGQEVSKKGYKEVLLGGTEAFSNWMNHGLDVMRRDKVEFYKERERKKKMSMEQKTGKSLDI